ncbi:hypothetical protein S40293_11454 [Stachybotrys chartarum IBT 40293]|nr:hypothetical protein S40293_11454 [Stachybotrys chartarum IBT 40293]
MEDTTFEPTEAYESLLLQASQDAQSTRAWKRVPSPPDEEIYECPERTDAQLNLARRFLRDHKDRIPGRRMLIKGPYRMKGGRAFIKDGSMAILPLLEGAAAKKDNDEEATIEEAEDGGVTALATENPCRCSSKGDSLTVKWRSRKPFLVLENESLYMKRGDLKFLMIQFVDNEINIKES